MSWTPPTCDVHHGPAIRISYGVRVFRMVDGRRCCASCLRDPGVRWLVMRANLPWYSDHVSVDWTPPHWLLKLVD